jgi:cystathionine beta-lyase
MLDSKKLSRRKFIRHTGAAALTGAAGSLATTIPQATAQSRSEALSIPRLADGRYDFDTPYERVGSNCRRWDLPARLYPDGEFKYGMGIASMDFECPAAITEALQDRVSHHSWGYLDSTDELIEEIVEWNGRYHGLDLDERMITVSDGVYPGIIAALRSIVSAGGRVLMTTPTYSGFYVMASQARVDTIDSPMRYDNGRYEIDWDDLEAKMTPDVRAMLVCNPQNPTGNVWTEDELLRIGRLCLARKVVVLADEIHSDFVRRGHRYVPFAGLSDRAVVENSVSFNAVSKTFNLAGMRNGYFYSKSPELRARVNEVHRADLSTLGVVANIAAYQNGRDWFEQVNSYLDDNHAFVEAHIAEHMPSVGYTRNEGTFMTFLDFSRTLAAIDAERLYAAHDMATPEHYVRDWLVKNSGVFLNPGSDYGAGGEGHMRMNIASSRQLLREALDAMAGAVNAVI